MPAGHVPDPHSPQSEKAWRDSVDRRLDSAKQRQQTNTTLGYASVTAQQLGMGPAFAYLTGLDKKVVAGTRRLLRVTGLVEIQKHTTKAAVNLFITNETSLYSVQKIGRSVDGTTNDFDTFLVIGIDTPAAGSVRYRLGMDMGSGTLDANVSGGFPSYLLIEDIGQAPA